MRARGALTIKTSIDLTQSEHDKLVTLSRMLGTTHRDIVRRMIDVLLLPDRPAGQRLCVCQGDHKVSDIAGI